MEKKTLSLMDYIEKTSKDNGICIHRYKVFDEEKGKDTLYHEIENEKLRLMDRLV